jgi:dihydroorotase
MSHSSRRTFLGQLGAAAIAPALPKVPFRVGSAPAAAAAAQQAAAPTSQAMAAASYDLLIAGGRVIDPSQKLSAERDVAILGGRIARIAPNIPPSQARQVYDAKGKIVTPGLIDIHTHVYKYGITLNVDSDIVGFQSGVTTVVDAGSTGAGTFQGFRKYVIDTASTRIYALLNISTIGLVVTNEIYLDPRMVDARAAIRTIGANRDRIMGIKVRVNGRHSDLAHDLEVMKVAREVGDATGLPIMMHWSVEPELLALLKRGDILAHPFNPPSANSSNVFGADGPQAEKILPQIVALKERGVWTDGQLATTHHSWEISEKAVKLGWFPDAISTDISRTPDGQPASVLVPMSEFLHLGMPLDQVIAGVTTTPAKIFNFPEKIATLEPGVTADVAVLELAQGNFDYGDQGRQTRTLNQHFVAAATVKGGIFLKGAPPPPGGPGGRGGPGAGGPSGPGGRGDVPGGGRGAAPAGGRGGRGGAGR